MCFRVEFQKVSLRLIAGQGLEPLEWRRLRRLGLEEPPQDSVSKPHIPIHACSGERQRLGHLLIAIHAAVFRQIDAHRRAEAEDVEDGVGVFLAGEAAELAAADSRLVLLLQRREVAADPVRDRGPIVSRGLLLLLGRHPA